MDRAGKTGSTYLDSQILWRVSRSDLMRRLDKVSAVYRRPRSRNVRCRRQPIASQLHTWLFTLPGLQVRL